MPLVTVVELVWVLSSSNGLNKDQLVRVLDLLLRRKEILVDRADLVLQAQRRFAKGGDSVSDCLIERIAQVHGCRATMPFDSRAAKAAGMTLLA